MHGAGGVVGIGHHTHLGGNKREREERERKEDRVCVV